MVNTAQPGQSEHLQFKLTQDHKVMRFATRQGPGKFWRLSPDGTWWDTRPDRQASMREFQTPFTKDEVAQLEHRCDALAHAMATMNLDRPPEDTI